MNRKRFYEDLLERSGWTFVQAFAASLIVTGFSWVSLGIGATAGGLAVCKAIVASQVGRKDTAALPDPPAK